MRRRLALVLLLACLGAQSDQPVAGYGPWKFGMSHADVEAFTELGPYEAVNSTGGLETYNGDFGGEPTNISFVFDDAGLQFVQIWAYEGADFNDAAAGLHSVYEHIIERFGEMMMGGGKLEAGLSLADLTDRIPAALHGDLTPLTVEQLERRGGKVSVAPPQVLRIEPIWQPTGARILATFRRSEDVGAYWVFLFYVRG